MTYILFIYAFFLHAIFYHVSKIMVVGAKSCLVEIDEVCVDRVFIDGKFTYINGVLVWTLLYGMACGVKNELLLNFNSISEHHATCYVSVLFW